MHKAQATTQFKSQNFKGAIADYKLAAKVLDEALKELPLWKKEIA